jgi:pimeloyl-ACP methyl ester carboxylesterase
MRERMLETRRGIKVRVFEGGEGPSLVFLHGAGGLFDENPFLDELARRFHVFAPDWPGYGASTGEERLRDMLDFTLHGWDVVDALGLERPHLVGHSMGGMIAAEMACLAPRDLDRLVLVGSAGLWLDDHPVPDLFSLYPHELAPLLSRDAAKAERLLTGGVDFNDQEALKEFLIGNSRRLGTAGKILFPIPNRGLSERLYRLRAPCRILWGEEDRLIPLVYAERFRQLLPHAELVTIADAGHLLPYEQPEEFVERVGEFLA